MILYNINILIIIKDFARGSNGSGGIPRNNLYIESTQKPKEYYQIILRGEYPC